MLRFRCLTLCTHMQAHKILFISSAIKSSKEEVFLPGKKPFRCCGETCAKSCWGSGDSRERGQGSVTCCCYSCSVVSLHFAATAVHNSAATAQLPPNRLPGDPPFLCPFLMGTGGSCSTCTCHVILSVP